MRAYILVLAACSSSPPVVSPPPAAPVAPVAKPAVDPRLAELGVAGPPAAPSAAARKAFAAAQKTHDPDAAEHELQAALAACPELAEARYRLAVLEATRGDHAAARKELQTLLAADLQGFEQRIADEPALASDAGSLGIAELDARWAEAIAHGVPTLLFAGEHGDQEILMPRVLRAGVWVAEAKRFFALGPPIEHAIDAFVDLAHQQVVTVTMAIDDCHSDFCPRVEKVGIELWSLGAPSHRIATWSGHGELTHDATVQLVDGGVRVQYDDCNNTGCKSEWLRIDATGEHRDPVQHALPDATTLLVDFRGGALSLPLAGIALDGNKLVTGATSVELHRWHRTAEVHDLVASGSQVLVASSVDRCECAENFEGQISVHDVARVDLATGAVTSLAHGKLPATVVPGRDGSFYLQSGIEPVMRFPAIDAVHGEPLPDGVLLVPPPAGRYCCGL